MTIDELVEEFDVLCDWDERCDYLIDLGFELPEFPSEAKIAQNQVYGCQSNVWMICEIQPIDPPVIKIFAESDAIIVNGLIALLMTIFSGKTPQDILATNVEGIFARLGLDRHLSAARRNGLFGMVNKIRNYAKHAA